MPIFAKALREPLVHFLLIGVAVFALYSAFGEEPAPQRERIVVSEGRVQQLAEIFTRTWQRPPSAEELRGLVDGYVKEEVYYREAVKQGLDRDDTVIRRRMQQKMEFLIEPAEADLQANEAELEAFLAANMERFRVPPRLAFQQVFINPEKPEQPAALRAAATLKDLRKVQGEPDARQHGDPTLLPYETPLSPLPLIARNFGPTFAESLAALPQAQWSGPVASPYGLHIVRITTRQDGYDPSLEDVRAAVEQEWRRQEREAFAQQEYQRLRDGYDVVLPPAGNNGETLQ